MKSRAILIALISLLTFLLLVPVAIGVIRVILHPTHIISDFSNVLTHLLEVSIAIIMCLSAFYYAVTHRPRRPLQAEKFAKNDARVKFENVDLFYNQPNS